MQRAIVPTLIVLAISIVSRPAIGQTLTPTPAPTVTAESEPWFVSRTPLMIGGILYYPAGPQVHFNQNEMVRAGSFGSVPVYVQTTIEPRSVILIPLSGGLMQPYERRRSGELAGTDGSRPPSFPVVSAAESRGSEPRTIRAPGPPIGGVGVMREAEPAPVHAAPAPPAPPARPVGTSGTAGTVRTQPLASASRPLGLNGIFIEYSSRRWFNRGEAVPFDAALFKKVGTYAGLPVYMRDDAAETIFVPVSEAAAALVVPYTTARGR